MTAHPISQRELSEYRDMEDRLKLDAVALAGWRHSLIERMGGPDVVEPGPLMPHVCFRETGLTTQTEEGRRPVTTRHLIISGTP